MDSKTLCLGALMLGDASGYEIKKLFEEGPFSYFHQTSLGSIYPALGTLMEEGLVTCDERAQEGRPDKKVYSLTDAGRAAFKKAMEWPKDLKGSIRNNGEGADAAIASFFAGEDLRSSGTLEIVPFLQTKVEEADLPDLDAHQLLTSANLQLDVEGIGRHATAGIGIARLKGHIAA